MRALKFLAFKIKYSNYLEGLSDSQKERIFDKVTENPSLDPDKLVKEMVDSMMDTSKQLKSLDYYETDSPYMGIESKRKAKQIDLSKFPEVEFPEVEHTRNLIKQLRKAPDPQTRMAVRRILYKIANYDFEKLTHKYRATYLSYELKLAEIDAYNPPMV